MAEDSYAERLTSYFVNTWSTATLTACDRLEAAQAAEVAARQRQHGYAPVEAAATWAESLLTLHALHQLRHWTDLWIGADYELGPASQPLVISSELRHAIEHLNEALLADERAVAQDLPGRGGNSSRKAASQALHRLGGLDIKSYPPGKILGRVDIADVREFAEAAEHWGAEPPPLDLPTI